MLRPARLWFDRIAEEDFPKTRVVCVILHREHFQLGVVRAPQVRGIFQLGHAWDQARRLILTFAGPAAWPKLEVTV